MRCPKCKAHNFERSDYCLRCGALLQTLGPGSMSGAGGLAPLPADISGWNWGAFLLGWIWGIGNNVWVALLELVPGAGLIMPFILGAKGNEWAWQNKRWGGVEHFKRTQRMWAVWGALLGAIGLLCLSAYVALLVIVTMADDQVP